MTASEAILLFCDEFGVEPLDQKGELKINIAYRIRFIEKNILPDQIENYVKKILMSVKSEFLKKGALPSLATMDELTRPSQDELEHKGSVCFEKILQNVHIYRDLVLEDKRAIAGLDRVGGWQYLCSSLVSDHKFSRERFIKAYASCDPKKIEHKRFAGIGTSDKVVYLGSDSGRVLIEQTKDNSYNQIESEVMKKIGVNNG